MDSLSLETCLDKLECSICNRLLSIFPIYTMKDHENNGLLSVCGRCKVLNIENSLRCEIFENLAKIIKFPCIYREKGCMEILLPEDMKQHELNCLYRYDTCVFNQQNNCEWKGCFNQLLQHCEDEHKDLVLKDYYQFEFNLSEDYSLTNILLYYHEVFLFKLNFKQESNQLNCSLIPLGFDKITEEYYGKINLTTADTKLSKMFPVIEIDRNNSNSIDIYVHSILNEKDTKVIGIIKISDCIEKLNRICDTENCQQLSTILKCFVCDKININYSCNGGHYVCEDCKDKCCQTSVRHVSGKKILSFISQKCIYCGFRGDVDDINAHDSDCSYQPIDCDYGTTGSKCTWKDRRMKLLQHFIQNHKQDMIKLNEKISLMIEMGSDEITFVSNKYLHYCGCLFQVIIITERPQLIAFIHLRAKPRKIFHFEFEVVLGSHKYPSLKTTLTDSCNRFPITYYFHKDQFINLMSNKILELEINVSKIG